MNNGRRNGQKPADPNSRPGTDRINSNGLNYLGFKFLTHFFLFCYFLMISLGFDTNPTSSAEIEVRVELDNPHPALSWIILIPFSLSQKKETKSYIWLVFVKFCHFPYQYLPLRLSYRNGIHTSRDYNTDKSDNWL